MRPLIAWAHWKEKLPEKFKNTTYVELGFLKEELEVEPDGFGGTDKIFYYQDGRFYTYFLHWDGGNMWANHSYGKTSLTPNGFAELLESKKAIILSELSEHEKAEFESIFNEVKAFLLCQFSKDEETSICQVENRQPQFSGRQVHTLNISYAEDGVPLSTMPIVSTQAKRSAPTLAPTMAQQTIGEPITAECLDQLIEIVKRENLSMLICHLENESKGFIFDHRRQPYDTVLRKFSDTYWGVYCDTGFWPMKENIHYFDTQQKACKMALAYARAANKLPNKPSTETQEYLLHWALDASGTLTLSGNGPMASVRMPEYRIINAKDLAFEKEFGDWSLNEGDVDGDYTLPWHRVDGIKVQRVIVEAGLTTVSMSAFAPFCVRINGFFPCKYDSLKEIFLPDTMESLEWESIVDCPVLEKVVIPASVTKIRESKMGSVFDRCPNLTIHTPKGSYAESFAKQHGITAIIDPLVPGSN